MIDLKNKPEGATHYDKCPVRYFKYSDDKKDMYYFTGDGWIKLSHWPNRGTVFKIPDWNIYSNDKPLSELSDEQASQIVNWLRKGLSTQYLRHCEWVDWPAGNSLINIDSTYRAKQKTERELFVEAGKKLAEHDNGTLLLTSLLGSMHDIGFKAPKVGE
jgi:hypothetical protein